MLSQNPFHTSDTPCDCSETAELLARLDRAGIRYEMVSAFEALMSDEPMFVVQNGELH